jgi:hypothetical protein
MKLLALAIVCLLPSAVGLEITAAEITETVAIGGIATSVQLTVTAPCNELRQLNPASSVNPTAEVKLMSELDDANLYVVGPSSITLTCALLDEEASETIAMDLMADGRALAGPHIGTYKATMGDLSDEATNNFTVNPIMILSMIVDGRIAEANRDSNFTADFPVELENLGNSDIRVTFAPEGDSIGGILNLPEPTLIAYDDYQSFIVTAQYTGENPQNDQVSFTFSVTPEDVATGKIGQPVLQNVILRAHDFQAGQAMAKLAQNQETPTGIFLPTLGLLALALFTRR